MGSLSVYLQKKRKKTLKRSFDSSPFVENKIIVLHNKSFVGLNLRVVIK